MSHAWHEICVFSPASKRNLTRMRRSVRVTVKYGSWRKGFSMGKRLLNTTALAVIIFLQAASLVYACPGFYTMFLASQQASMDKGMGGEVPCGQTEKQGSPPVCYQVLINGFLYSSAGITVPASSDTRAISAVTPDLSYALFTSVPLAHPWQSFHKPSLVLLYRVLRI